MSYNKVIKEKFGNLFNMKSYYQLGYLDYLIYIMEIDEGYDEFQCQEWIKKRKEESLSYHRSLKERDVTHLNTINFDLYKKYVLIELELKRKEITDSLL